MENINIKSKVEMFYPLNWNGVGMCLCPNCENEIKHVPYPNPKRCSYCGQKLDWSESE